MRRWLKLLIALCVLTVAISGYFITVHLTREDKTTDASDTQTLSVYETDASSISKLHFTYNGEEVTLTCSENGVWTLEDDPNFPLDTDIAESMAAAFTSVTATKKVSEDASYKSEFGLESPQCTIDVTTSEGTDTFYIGDYNQNVDGYYFCAAGSDTSYLIGSTLPDLFCVTKGSLIELDTFSTLSSSDITSVTINDLDLLSYTDGNPNYYSASQKWFAKDNIHGETAADTDSVNTLLTSLASLSYSGCADYDITDEDMETYGFKTPAYTVTVKYTVQSTAENEGGDSETVTEENSFVLYIGAEVPEGGYYVLREGASMICTMTSTTLSSVISASVAELRDDTVFAMSIDTVVSAKLATSAGSITVDVSDGNEHTGFESLFNALTELSAEGQAESSEYSGTSALSAVFTRNTDSFHEMTFELYEYDSNFYRVVFNNRSDLLIGKRAAESLIALAEASN